jgi:hypothetical protein
MQKYSPMFAYVRMDSLNARKIFQRRPDSCRWDGEVTDEFRRTLRALISQDYLSPDGRQCRLREIFGLPPKPPGSRHRRTLPPTASQTQSNHFSR